MKATAEHRGGDTRVLLVDDHAAAREWTRSLLAAAPRIQVVGEAADGVEAVQLVRELRPQVVCMDVSLPRMGGTEATRRIREEQPQVAVIAVSGFADRQLMVAMMEAGAAAYVLKKNAAEELVRVITDTAAGVAGNLETGESLRQVEYQSEEILDTLADPLLVLDADLEVQRANREFHRRFQLSVAQLQHRHLQEVAQGAWGDPELHGCLEEVAQRPEASREVEIEGDFPILGHRVLHCCARSTGQSDPQARLVLLHVQDITERRRMEEHVMRYQRQLQRMANRLTVVAEQERRRIAQDLHDRIGQALSAIQMRVGVLRRSAAGGEQLDALDRLYKLIDQTVQDTRSLTFEINPPVLYSLGLEAALEWLVEHFEGLYGNGLHVTFADDGETKPLSEECRGQLFRSVRELLVNAVKHAEARHVRISLRRMDRRIRIEVADDGRGFDAARLDAEDADGHGVGLFGVGERMDALGGVFEIDSAPGAGTRAVLVAPLDPEAALQ